jgi:SAM-dependent methyltransferase
MVRQRLSPRYAWLLAGRPRSPHRLPILTATDGGGGLHQRGLHSLGGVHVAHGPTPGNGSRGPGTQPAAPVHHPWFSRLYPFAEPALQRMVGQARAQQNSQAVGRTLIIGAGTGLDVPVLGTAVSDVVLLEPDATMRGIVARRYPGLPCWGAPAESIPSPPDAFNTVISSLVLCSVIDLDQVLDEIARVLKPGGQLLFLEHVVSRSAGARLLQHTVDPAWRHLAGGCRLTQDVEARIRSSPMALVEYEPVRAGGLLPVVRGRALAPGPAGHPTQGG